MLTQYDLNITIKFPRDAKKKVLTQRGNLRIEVSSLIAELLASYYSANNTYKAFIEDADIPIKIELTESTQP